MTTNLASLLTHSAAAFPTRTALVAGDVRLDYVTVDAMARTFAGALAGLGIQPGEHVAVVLPNVPQFTVAFFGCQYASAPVVPLNVLLTTDELAYHLEDSQAVAVVAWEAFLPTVSDAAARAGCVRHVLVAGPGDGACAGLPAGVRDLAAGPGDGACAGLPAGVRDLAAEVALAAPVAQAHRVASDDTAVVLYTSGTTGRPKGAELTHANLLANARVPGGLVDLGPDTVALVALPLFHAFGMTVMHNAVLAVGGALVLLPRFGVGEALDLMARHRVSFFGGVPTMYAALLQGVPAVAGGAGLPDLRWCVSGGAPLPAPVMAAFEERFGVCLLEGYGLSETSPMVSFTVPGRPRTPGSIGYPVPGVKMRLRDDDGRLVHRPGTPGEICVRGENVMKGYWRNPEATAAVMNGHWFRTGDIAVMDEHGAYRIVGRSKDLVIRGGYNVYPREVEDVLHAHPAVAMAAVLGVPDERYGEEVKAVVTLRPGSSASPAELAAWCKQRLAAYKYPRIVEVRDALPLGPTGKVLKQLLREPALSPAHAAA